MNLKTITITYKDGRKETHESNEYGGVTVIGFSFYSKTKKSWFYIHPQSVESIEYTKEKEEL